MGSLNLISHPIVEDQLAVLRSAKSDPDAFRAAARRITFVLVTEATRGLELTPGKVATPLGEAPTLRIAERIGVVPILRAGLGMVDAALTLLPNAEVWHIGIFRDHETSEPVEYYNRLPKGDGPDVALVFDPMLATGGSATAAIGTLVQSGVANVKMLCLIASRRGADRLVSEFPDVDLYTAAIDPELDGRNYIVPGLGDAGDRTFNTLRAAEERDLPDKSQS